MRCGGGSGGRGRGRGEVVEVLCCFTSTETVGLSGTGAQDGHLDFHTAPELWREERKRTRGVRLRGGDGGGGGGRKGGLREESR